MNQQNQEQNEQSKYQERVERKHNYFYKIINSINEKFYYGIHSTDDLEDGYMGSGKTIKKAIEKHGIENFLKEIVADYPTRKEASDHEKLVVDLDMVSNPMCYNLRTGGDNGIIFSEETREKMRIANTGRRKSDELKRWLSEQLKGENNPFYGKKHTEETKQKNREAQIGRIITPETRRKISESISGEKNGFYMKTHTNESKKKMSEAHKKMSDITRLKISTAAKDRYKYYLVNDSKQCCVENVIFNSMKEASDALGVCRPTLKKRIESDDEKWSNWNYITFNDRKKI